MGYKPILTFDTSAIGGTGCLADEPDLDALIAGLRCGFHSRFTFTSVSEIIATTCGNRRRKQVDVCKRLLTSGECIEPPHEILRQMVRQFENSIAFDWRSVSIRFVEAEDEIARYDFTDALAEEEREQARALEKEFAEVYEAAKSVFDKVFTDGSAKRPGSVSEFMQHLQIEGGAFWMLAGKLYARVGRGPADEPTMRRFVEKCPPFNALMVSLFVAQYDRCLGPQDKPSLRCGRNDTFMSVCLPYCERFVTNDRRQLRCFREVVSTCQLRTRVQSYEEFRNGVLLAPA